MARTKDFSSAPPQQGGMSARKGHKRVTQDRFGEDARTNPNNAGQRGYTAQGAARQRGEGGHFQPTAEARSTSIMKPGQVPGAREDAPRKPRKSYGPTAGDAMHTVMMEPVENAQDQLKQAAGSMDAHPVSKNVQPPDIELVQHQIPRDAPADPRMVMLARPDSEQAAAFRILRHHVLDTGYPQVIAVSGPLDGCGKTTVAINLAMALAECGRAEVLLVDANLRNPKLASTMRFVPPWCFAEQLHAHRIQPFVPWRFVDVAQIGLHVAGIDPRIERNQRLDAPAFAIAMDRLKLGPYQHIVVDCPSVLGNADVNLIQDATDGVLLAARTKQVTARDIRSAVDQLTPTKILGTVLFES